MIKIPGLNQTEIEAIIDRIAVNHQNKVFNYHTPDDIYQKVWEICLEKLIYFNLDRGLYEDPDKCLEHWLNTVVARSLSNYKRDTYDVRQKPRKSDASEYDLEKRKSLANPIELNSITENFLPKHNADLLYEEYLNFLCKNLQEKDLILLEALLSGENVSAYYKSHLLMNIEMLNNEWKQVQ